MPLFIPSSPTPPYRPSTPSCCYQQIYSLSTTPASPSKNSVTYLEQFTPTTMLAYTQLGPPSTPPHNHSAYNTPTSATMCCFTLLLEKAKAHYLACTQQHHCISAQSKATQPSFNQAATAAYSSSTQQTPLFGAAVQQKFLSASNTPTQSKS